MRARRLAWLAGVLILMVPLVAAAQRFGFRGPRFGGIRNVAYDGRFTFARAQYARFYGWAADYPTMERNLTTILHEITELRPWTRGGNVYTFDDPELLKYPVSYLSEPGYWYPNEQEVLGLRQYLAKGGFLIVDDFHFPREWAVFERAMKRVLPEAEIVRLELSHPIFHTFFEISTLRVPYPGGLGEQGLMGEFFGIYENNDRSRRLTAIINYNIDLGDYVEWSAEELYNPQSTNEAYKFMVNYVIYGLTR
ncbi:MAG: DUF4159 domain-containing protein, partial [Vicinamibacterales bacterium]